MSSRSNSLILDAPVEALDFVVTFLLCAVFVGLVALLLWPLGQSGLAVRLAKGYVVLWGALALVFMVLSVAQSILRVNIYDHPDMFVYSNLAAGVLLLPCWSAFAALAVGGLAAGASPWAAALLYFLGLLSSFVGWKVVSAYYRGHVYQFVNLPVALASFALFAAWPAAGRALYGWFFDLF